MIRPKEKHPHVSEAGVPTTRDIRIPRANHNIHLSIRGDLLAGKRTFPVKLK